MILNEAGEEVMFYGESGGKRANSNIAEFEAAIKGVRYAIHHGAQEVKLISDCSSVVCSKSSNYSEPLHSLRAMLLEEGAKLEAFEIVKGTRDEVDRAHKYATIGRTSKKNAAVPPEEIEWGTTCYYCHQYFMQPAKVDTFTMVCPACRD